MTIRMLIVILIIITFSQCNNFSSLGSAQKLFIKGTDYQNCGNICEAYNYFKKALNENWNPVFEWAAASTAPNRYMAHIHAQAAWSGGLRDKELFVFLLNTCQFETIDSAYIYSINLLSQMHYTQISGYLKGQIHYNLRDHQTAMSIWQDAWKTKPDADLAAAISDLYFTESMYDSLFSFCNEITVKKLINESTLTLCAYAFAHTRQFDKADSILVHSKNETWENDFHEERAWLHYFSGDIDSAIKILEKSLKKTKKRSVQKKLMLSFFYCQNSDTTKLKKLQSKKYQDFEKDIPAFANTMLLLSRQDSLTFDKLETQYSFFKHNTAYHFVRARLNIGKAPLRSLESFELLPSLITRFPDITLEYVTVLNTLGEFTSAISLLTSLHDRGIYSKVSLAFYRDLAFKLDFFNESFATANLLEQLFPDDINIKLNNIQLLINSKKLSTAESRLLELRKRFPNIADIHVLYIRVLFMMKQYEKVLLECNASTAPPLDILPIKARTLMKLDRIPEAEQIYKMLNAK